MPNITLIKEKEDSFTAFPQEIEKYFFERNVTLSLYPNDIVSEQETGETTLQIASASQYSSYIDDELSFWRENDPKKILEPIVHYNRLQDARRQFDNALNYTHSSSSMNSYLDQSIRSLFDGVLFSKSKLAKELLKHKDKTTSFTSGFKAGISTKEVSISSNSDAMQGFYAAMAYRNVFRTYASSTKKSLDEFKTKVEEATLNYSALNENYTKSFLDQKERISDIVKQTNEHLSNIDEKKEEFFNSAKQRIDDLEHLYGEKLKLSEPAKYWENIDKDYNKKGTKWLLISVGLAILIVAGLIAFLWVAPELFSDSNHWFDNLKNSAIITVVASIAIYMLRFTVKMATSSYHLSRDAKERNNLSYFYLALIEKDAVSDKERALILNALFSRSDTGLLKGESSPSMPTNISDIVEMFKKDN